MKATEDMVKALERSEAADIVIHGGVAYLCGVTYKTADYSIFKKMGGNRGVTKPRKKRIYNSIQKVGLISEPILVNENFEVANGQGRLAVCEENNMPVYFMIIKGLSLNECIAMNTVGDKWKSIEFIDSYAERGNESYKRLKYALEKYDQFTLNSVYGCFADTTGTGGGSTERIADEMLVIDDDAYEDGMKQLEFLASIWPQIKFIKGQKNYILGAYRWAYKHSSASTKALVADIDDVVLQAETMCGKNGRIRSVEQMLSIIEAVYNKKRRSKNDKVFFTSEFIAWKGGKAS